jgi:hypothetical protein
LRLVGMELAGRCTQWTMNNKCVKMGDVKEQSDLGGCLIIIHSLHHASSLSAGGGGDDETRGDPRPLMSKGEPSSYSYAHTDLLQSISL